MVFIATRNRSFFQSVCLLGYCIFPVLLSAGACWIINSFVKNDFAVVFRFISVAVALLWSLWGKCIVVVSSTLRYGTLLFSCIRFLTLTPLYLCCKASSSFLADARFPEGRKLLALYPVLLFYLSLAWIVLIGFQQSVSEHGAIAEATPPKVNVTNPSSEAAGSERALFGSLITSL
ncbi:unnamed protein product [Chondrus crispus]|uniref:Protein YIPF n=1 Tax=Chondrus crispus TaxID=2769 RepID=R7QJD3_CHOCR|nr:unnamed protein product [Chondrus crispus]CDF38627.1 unnamed protein product [Chondrus crispus]|eukprot:XP_005718532.1 unnamed protein product [Chondrus crispus]